MRRLLLLGTAVVLSLAAGLAPAFAEYQAEHRGGTMRLVARSAAGTVDPHINYTLQYWQIYQGLYDGLIAFKKAAGADGFIKVPDLAEEIPAPTNDGKT
jgi:peptide/nickel transport system substrate-binding protein